MASFENTKSEIVSSGLGQALALTASSVWSQIVDKIKAIVNRGTLNWSGSNTTYSVPAGYYSGGNLDSRPSYNNGYNAGVAAADGRVNTGSASYTSGYNAGVNAGKNTMASTLVCVYGYANNADSTKTYTASSAGYYLAITCAAGTGNANQNRSVSISTNGSSKSYTRHWVADSISTSQGKCQHCVAVMLVYLNSGNTVTMTWDSDYNKSGHAIVYRLG